MKMNLNVVRGVCHLLGLDPDTTTRIDIDAGERTVNISSVNITNGFSLQHEEHRVAPEPPAQKPGWELTDKGFIGLTQHANPWDWEAMQEESPIFCATAVSHNRTKTRRDRWLKL